MANKTEHVRQADHIERDGRKVAAGVFAAAGYVGLRFAAVYLAGVLFLVLNKANPRQAHFTSIVHYWDLYADDTALRRKLLAAMGMSGVGLLILFPGVLVPSHPALRTAGQWQSARLSVDGTCRTTGQRRGTRPTGH